nr:fibronectin type III domain-containing protein [Acidobacteriota bacterium]
GVPAAPSGLVATAVSSAQIDTTWADNSANETGFKLYRSTDGVNFFRTATLGANVTTYSDTGRPASTTFYYRVVAYNAEGNSADSNTVAATTFPPATVKPAAPTGLVAVALSGTQIRLTWADNSTNEDSFRIDRSADGVSFTQVFKTGANATTHTDTGLTSGRTYFYRIRASNDAGNSAYSNTASARTP